MKKIFFLPAVLLLHQSVLACMSCGMPVDKMIDSNTLQGLIESSYQGSDVLSTRWQRPLFSQGALDIYSMKKEFCDEPLNNQILYARDSQSFATEETDLANLWDEADSAESYSESETVEVSVKSESVSDSGSRSENEPEPESDDSTDPDQVVASSGSDS